MAEPAITLRAAHDSGPLAMPVTRIVIHATCPNVGYPTASAPGAAAGTARYFAQASSGGSAHYVEDPTTETHCVPDNVTAWHAPPNGNSIGIEICAEGGDYPNSYTRDQWLSPQVWPGVLRAADRARELCDRFAVPKTKIGPADLLAGAHGVCGHVDVSTAWHQSTHSDPGPAFPWPEFMAAVNQEDDMDINDLINYRATQYDGATRSLYDSANQTLANIGALSKQVADLTTAVAALKAAIGQQAGSGADVKAIAAQLTVVPKS